MRFSVFFRLVILVCLTFSLGFALSDSERLDAARNAFSGNDDVEQFRAYNDCKTIYLRANLDKNTTLSKDALELIVIGGEKLGVDVSKYRAELAKIKPLPKPVTLPKAEISEDSVKTTDTPGKFLTPQPEKLTRNEPAPKPESLFLVKRHRLMDSRWKNSGLELVFDSSLSNSDIKISKIIETDKKRFRYIIDIDSATLSKSTTLEHKEINRIKIAQYDPKIMRIVIEHNAPVAIKTLITDKVLYIDLNVTNEQTTPPLPSFTVAPKVEEPPLPITALPPLVSVTPKDRSKKTIVIDPGHGGKDSGAKGNGYLEKDIVLSIGTQLADKLRAQGYTVYMTRSNDTFIELKDRTKFANDKMADLFISVHANSIPKTTDPMGAQGLETYFLSPARSERSMRVAALENSEDMNEMGQYGKLSFLSFLNTEKIIASNKLAIDLQKGMLGNLRKQFPNVRDNGVREAPFWVLVGAQMPAVLIEVGYISHPDESSRIADDKYQKWMIDGILDGVGRYFANNG